MKQAIDKKMNVLVLGGNGFIGSHLLDHLVQAGHQVRVFDRQNELYRSRQAQVEYVMGHFGDRASLIQVLTDIDIVFHLISTTVPKSSNRDPSFDVLSNVIETLFLLEQCVKKGVKKIVFASSGGAVYGMPQQLPVGENHPTHPESSYGITKLMIEKYLHLFHRLHGLEYTIVRPSNPYGPRQNILGIQGVIAVFMGKILRGEPIEIWGSGNAQKDYIFIDDLVTGIYKAGFAPSTDASVFNLGSGVGTSINEIVRTLTKVAERKVEIVYKPVALHDVAHIYLDITHAKRQLDWQPSFSLQSGIEIMWQFVRELSLEN